ncbi:hypothetical protein TRFO_14139 [Tritrichomonas foetus]|uniref:Phosphoprotein phosphatase n=1 Tax=Tritrichomonas foetus TaxID=1144522 RepID=A0A1J4KW72_9EUKA|nr:hypothetical protein TRFO_14139 [Tritrichomonas foetus]|eukprot:OHT15386.1 hypothetical protein TRFO_14139 [Tritrichomonas foetus]
MSLPGGFTRTKSSSLLIAKKSPSVGIKRPYLSIRAPTLDPIDNDNEVIQSTEEKSETITEFNPVVDFEINNVVSLTNVRDVSTKELPIIELPPIPPVKDASFEMILSAKLELCSENLDFIHKEMQLSQKDEKRKTLNEFIAFFDNTKEAKKMNSVYQRAFFRMIEKNIFRNDPKFPTALETYNYTLNVVEPSWPHLMFCYQLLTRFIQVFPNAEFVSFSVFKKALFLMQLPDANERYQLVVFTKLYYDIRQKEQQKILREVKNSLIMLRSGLYKPFCLMPLFLLFAHILMRRMNNIDEDCIRAFKEGALPLIGFPYMHNQYSHFKTFFTNAVHIHPSFIYLILEHLQKKWPRQSGSKIQMMLDFLIHIVITNMPQADFSQMSQAFFSFLASQLRFTHLKFNIVILSLWTKEEYRKFIVANSAIAIDRMLEQINNVAKKHWDEVIRKKAEQVLNEMCSINSGEYHKKRLLLKRKANIGIQYDGIDDATTNADDWAMIASQVITNQKKLSAKLNEIDEYFHKYKDDTEVRFIPRNFKYDIKKQFVSRSFNANSGYQSANNLIPKSRTLLSGRESGGPNLIKIPSKSLLKL